MHSILHNSIRWNLKKLSSPKQRVDWWSPGVGDGAMGRC